ncbi:hypothetical protein J2W91_004577 [Paenibacillus amylolyticus]|uniref:Uncharacterized protein n=1 Tax=Paenibacillus amylolyticus TaxID=1451 RepID=A0AAP5H6R7_PAEAM|nr:hypothetical protein [Paenibacillus amylolyticus]
MKKIVGIILAVLMSIALLNADKWFGSDPHDLKPVKHSETVQLLFPTDRYPETALHILHAIE